MKFREKLARFFYGRYGVDELYYGLFALWGVLLVINIFARSGVIAILELVPLGLMLFRSLSKNIPARRRENEVFLRFWKPVKSWFAFQRDRIRDRKTARYRVCPKCKARIKLPVNKGKHTVPCPRCGERFETRIH